MSNAVPPRLFPAALGVIGGRVAPTSRLPRTVARAASQATHDAALIDGMPIGGREFIDGVVRTVHLDPDRQQYIVGSNGEKVYGVWLLAPGPARGVPA
jgi:hypothetical protein